MSLTKAELHLDYAALGSLMRSAAMRGQVTAIAHVVAQSITGASRVYVDSYTTDRGAASVTVVERNARELERLTGRLANAARGAGLEVTIRG